MIDFYVYLQTVHEENRVEIESNEIKFSDPLKETLVI